MRWFTNLFKKKQPTAVAELSTEVPAPIEEPVQAVPAPSAPVDAPAEPQSTVAEAVAPAATPTPAAPKVAEKAPAAKTAAPKAATAKTAAKPVAKTPPAKAAGNEESLAPQFQAPEFAASAKKAAPKIAAAAAPRTTRTAGSASVVQLREQAKSLGLTGYSRLSKSELLDLIEKAK